MMTEVRDSLPLLPLRVAPFQEDAHFSEAELGERFGRAIRPHENVIFEFTRDPAYLQQYYQLREQVYTERLSHFSGQEDEFDRHGLILIARRGRQVVAGVRMLIHSPRSRHLLALEADGVDLRAVLPELNLDNITYCECSRLARLPEYCGMDFAVQMNRAFKRKAIAHGVKYCFVLAPLSQTRNHRLINQIDNDTYIVRDDIPIPDHEHYEGIQMVLSYLVYPEHFVGEDEYGEIHLAENAL